MTPLLPGFFARPACRPPAQRPSLRRGPLRNEAELVGLPQMSAPDALILHVPRLSDCPPASCGLPISPQLQPRGHTDPFDADLTSRRGDETAKWANVAFPSLLLTAELTARPG